MKWPLVPLSATRGQNGLITDGDWILSENMDRQGEIRLIQLADIGLGEFLDRSQKFINSATFNELQCTELFENDILISRMADPIGRACLLPKLEQRAITAVDITVVRVDRKVVEPRYISYVCNSPTFLAEARSAASGTTRSRITRRNLERIQIPLPPLSEQRRIVEILDQADALRRLRAEADVKAQRILPALFLKMFGDGAPNSSGWPSQTISQLAEQRRGSIRTGPFGSQLRHAEFISKGVPVLGIDNVVTNRFRWARVRCLPLERYDEFKQFRVLPGDVLITIMGTTGRVCVVPSDLPECMSTKHLCVITFDRSKIDPVYAWASVLHDPFVRQQVRTSGHGAIMEGWNMGIVSSLRLRRPPIEQQREFADLVLRLEKQWTHQDNVDETLDELFSSLAHRAFSGELTAKWREAHRGQLRAEMAEQEKLLNLSVPEAAKAHG